MDTRNPWADQDVFEDEVFSDLEWPNADLSAKEFIRCTFRRVVLTATHWSGARLDDCTFDACDLTRMKPAKMSALGVAFIGCRLLGVDWTGIRPNPTMTFEGCNLQYASFVEVNLTKARFTRCRLVEVNFIESRLVDVEFAGSDLRGSRFEDCDLRDADFSESQGGVIDPAKNRVKGTRISVAMAVLVAMSAGMRVAGFERESEDPPG
jgi:fluoroquinolone resistance protein